jgi:hypothetical protein
MSDAVKLECFTDEERYYIRQMLKNPNTRGHSGLTNNDHARHCVEQIIRISQMFIDGTFKDAEEKRRREFQLPYNIGRLQEIFEGVGGMKCWWNVFSKLYVDGRYVDIEATARSYAHEIGLTLNPETFL